MVRQNAGASSAVSPPPTPTDRVSFFRFHRLRRLPFLVRGVSALPPNQPETRTTQRPDTDVALPSFFYEEQYQRGFAAFAEYVAACAAQAPPAWSGAVWFVLRIGEDCANIRLQEMWRPWRLLADAARVPPQRFGPTGFDPSLVDDHLPARHYIAFVFVGFWLPPRLAQATLYAWEVAGFVRYGFQWSAPDLRLGRVGLRHGMLVNRYGPTVMPSLLTRDLAAHGAA